MPEEEKKDGQLTMADIVALSVTAGVFVVAGILKHRRNRLHDEIRKQPVITEDAEFEVLDDKKEIKLIEDKPANQQ